MSERIEIARHAIAVLFVISLPPAVAWWFVVHPLIDFWRRLGTRITFSAIGIAYIASVAALWTIRDLLVGVDLGLDPVTIAIAVPLMAVTVVIALRRRKHLTLRVLTGIPEVAGEAGDEALLDQGIYGVIRHPRYLEFVIGGTAWALILNYVGVYACTAAAVAAILVIVPLEERELRERFGDRYIAYSARVPRFVPRLRGRR